MIKNCIFDLGNVILKGKPSIILDNLNLDDETYHDIKNNFFNNWSKLDLGLISLDSFFYQCNFKSTISNEIKEKLINYYKYRPFNLEILNILRDLKNKKYSIYLLSNNNKETADYLRTLDFYQYIDGDVYSCDYNTVKPNIEIYKILLNKYNLITKECLFIDDDQNNIETATKLGFKTIKYNSDNYNTLNLKINNIIDKNN